MDDVGRPDRLLGMDVKYNADGSILLHVTSYIRKMLVKFGMEDAKASKTPMDAGTKLSKKDEPSVQAERSNFPYRELVASHLSLLCFQGWHTVLMKM